MKRNFVLFIDSGLGGISILSKSMKLCPANYIYFADNLHCPYGSYNKKQIHSFLKSIILDISKKFSLKLVVLACNTATTSSIKKLREEFPNLKFIGTEPALSLAKKQGYKKVFCIATPATIKQKKFIILSNSLNINVNKLPLKTLAKSIEDYLTLNNFKDYLNILKSIFYVKSKLKENECLVLGCTHYALINDIISKYINLPLIDGSIGVSNMIINSLKPNYNKKSNIKFILSNDKNQLKQKYIKILNQILAKD